MGLDIRLPLGLMFALLGVLLLISGLVMDKGIYQRSLGININFWWGLVLLVFGIIMLLLGRRKTAAMRSAMTSTEGMKVEDLEHRTGLEREPAKGD